MVDAGKCRIQKIKGKLELLHPGMGEWALLWVKIMPLDNILQCLFFMVHWSWLNVWQYASNFIVSSHKFYQQDTVLNPKYSHCHFLCAQYLFFPLFCRWFGMVSFHWLMLCSLGLMRNYLVSSPVTIWSRSLSPSWS